MSVALKNRFRNFLASLCVFASCSALVQCADASLPRLIRVMPRGVQRGVQHTLTFVGERLGDTEDVFFYENGFRTLAVNVIDPQKVEVTIEVGAACRLGEHIVQLRTRSGVSDYRILHVEAYPSIEEDESAGSRDDAQTIVPVQYSSKFPKARGIVVSGRILDEDHDWFALSGRKGERLSIEVVAMRLGDYCDSVLELIGPNGKSIATVDDTPLTRQDPALSVTLPDDGRYLIHLSDAAGRGRNDAYYRMHIGNFPRPSIAVPAVAAEEVPTKVRFLGDGNGPIDKVVKVRRQQMYWEGIYVSDDRGTTPTPVPFRVTEYALVQEQEPNDSKKKVSPRHSLPFSAYGKIDRAHDSDWYVFRAFEKQRLRIEVFGHRIGSSIDPTIRLRNGDGRVLVTSTDAEGTDSLIDYEVLTSGWYYVEVTHVGSDFGPMIRYQLDVGFAEPSFKLNVQQFERLTQQRQQIAVPANNRFAVVFSADRRGYDGAIRLPEEQMPFGIKMFARRMPAGSNSVPVVFEAATNTAAYEKNFLESSDMTRGQLIKFYGESIVRSDVSRDETIKGYFQNRAETMRVQPNNISLKYATVDKLAVAIIEPVPFKVILVPPPAPISQNGRAKLVINIQRQPGFDAPILLRLPFRPSGVSAKGTVRVKPNQTSVSYPINANSKAAIGTWPICVTAVAPNSEGSMVSTELRDLEVVTPFVSVDSDLVTGVAGVETNVRCSLEVLRDFSGEAKAVLRGLPQDISAAETSFNKDDTSIEFKMKLGKKCATGKNHRVPVEVTIVQGDHPIVFDAGNILLRVSSNKKRKGSKRDWASKEKGP